MDKKRLIDRVLMWLFRSAVQEIWDKSREPNKSHLQTIKMLGKREEELADYRSLMKWLFPEQAIDIDTAVRKMIKRMRDEKDEWRDQYHEQLAEKWRAAGDQVTTTVGRLKDRIAELEARMTHRRAKKFTEPTKRVKN